MTTSAVALKEWAVTIQALSEGRQILLMRKGGIAEETRDFRLTEKRFYLFPSYEHQKEALLKDEYKPMLGAVMAGWKPEERTVQIAHSAEAVADLEISSSEELERLRNLHIWTDSFADERLRWKRSHPLHILLLRVRRLDEPFLLPLREEYGGCKSWVNLDASDCSLQSGVPVLGDEEFARAVHAVQKALE
ncbi:DUF1802 family protein [Gorillibacterium timonense]|uniref:DUF1802 family protein n=1 Tax=Gorillibacterium timonense TaxID=1689269 RepID=UPI00071C2E7E|nr:DUF1802 family protein [Gorillibacterium timonense]